MRGRSGVANCRFAEGCCVTVIRKLYNSNGSAPLEHSHSCCIGWSTALAVQLRPWVEPALAAAATETLPQALKRDPGTDGSQCTPEGRAPPMPIHWMRKRYGQAGARRGARSMPGGEFRGVGYVEFVDLVVDLVGREAG